MTTTDVLAITYIEQSQSLKEVTANQATNGIARAVADTVTIDLSTTGATPYTMVSPDPALRAMRFKFTGALSGTYTVKHPASKHLFVVDNSTTGGHDVVVTTPSGTGITVVAGTPQLAYCDGVNVTGLLASAGTTGATGAPGTVWREGSGAPSSGTGIDGDYYLNTANGDVYRRASGTYSVVGNIKGATGATGSTGATGASTTWREGSGVPSNSLGINGDFYLNGANGDVYLKAAGAYTVQCNIMGPSGGGGGGSSTLAGDTDVAISGLTTHDLLGYDGSHWINHALTLLTGVVGWDAAHKDTTVTLTGVVAASFSGTAQGTVLATPSHATGKWYFEVTFTSGTIDNNSSIGVTQVTTPLTASQLGFDTTDGSTAIFGGGDIYQDGTTTINPGAWNVVSRVVKVAVDAGGRLVWFKVGSGNWNAGGSADPATGVGGIAIPGSWAIVPGASTDIAAVLTINLVPGSPPSGFSAWTTTPFSLTPSDVNVTGPSDGQILKYDGGTSKWKNTAGSPSTLATQGDVSLASLLVGQGLGYNGAAWQNMTLTLASATVGYWDSAHKNSSVTLSNGNLSASFTPSTNGSVLGLPVKSSGKWYFEVAFTSGFSGSTTWIGLATQSMTLTNLVGNEAVDGSIGVNQITGAIQSHNSTLATMDTYGTNGDVIEVAVDVPNNLVWIRKSGGNWNGSSSNHPETGTGGLAISGSPGSIVPAMSGGTAGSTQVFTINLGATAFTETPPTGFSAWSSGSGGGLSPTDAFVSSPASGQRLVYDGSKWVNAAVASQNVSTSTATVTPGTAPVVTVNLSANTTLTLAAGVNGQRLELRLVQDGTGSRTVAFGGSSVGFGTTITSFTATTTASKTDILDLTYNSTLSKWLLLNVAKGF